MPKIFFILISLVLQSAASALMLFISIPIMLRIMRQVTSHHFPIQGFLTLFIVMLTPVLVSAVYVFLDAKERYRKNLETYLPPILWAIIVTIFWFPGLTAYLYIKKYISSAAQEVRS